MRFALLRVPGVLATLGRRRAAPADILDRLARLPGVVSVQEQPAEAPYRYFELVFRQLVDHTDPRCGVFDQRVGLMHRDVDAPMVLCTSGYAYRGEPFRSEPTEIVDGNQIDVEHRYYGQSRPQPVDWTKLTIRQAATDVHVIVAALRGIYRGRWLSTGRSKGGLTATFHRRFYPDDVHGTVAYVASNGVIDPADAYERFFDTVGEPACRADLRRIQRETLARRPELLELAQAVAERDDLTYTVVGSLDHSLELAVVEAYTGFWQYAGPGDSAAIPPAGAPAQAIYDWYETAIGGLAAYSDQGVEPLTAFFYQASTQLGSPPSDERHLADLLRYPGTCTPRTLLPQSIATAFDHSAMPDIDAWVRSRGRRLLYVYGQDDPWSANPYRFGPGTCDSYAYWAAGDNHDSQITTLADPDAAAATATIRRWAGVAFPDPDATHSRRYA